MYREARVAQKWGIIAETGEINNLRIQYQGFQISEDSREIPRKDSICTEGCASFALAWRDAI
jgi:hypothetical protein